MGELSFKIQLLQDKLLIHKKITDDEETKLQETDRPLKRNTDFKVFSYNAKDLN